MFEGLAAAGFWAVAAGFFAVVAGFVALGLAGAGLGGVGSSLHPNRKKSINVVINIELIRFMGLLLLILMDFDVT